MSNPLYLRPDREAVFPNLRKDNYRVTGAESKAYNCIAHAAGKDDARWWPAPEEDEDIHWPEGVARVETLEAFSAAFATLGYVPCAGSDLADGFEKIALYATEDETPTHAARQLPSGSWTSKLGEWEVIEHETLDAVNCPEYGKATKYLKRPRK